MGNLNVRVERLEPMRVAAVRRISETPERDAWEQLRSWAESNGLLAHPERHPVFGFNNPPPSKGRKEYGYEMWMRVDPGVSGGERIEPKNFPGGLYAVTSCKLVGDPQGTVAEVWHKLLKWIRDNNYRWRKTHELERIHNPLAPEQEIILDLYLPIEE